MTDTCEDDSYEEDPVILESKVKAALKVLGRNKSPRVDGIAIELFEARETESVKILTRKCQQIQKTKQWSTDWKHSINILIFKKGDAKECSKYRTTALISHTSKVMPKMM